jgi:hypothetical protein
MFYFNSAASEGKKDGGIEYPSEKNLDVYRPNGMPEVSLPSYEIERLVLAEKKIVNIIINWEKIKHKLESRLIMLDRELKIQYNEFQNARKDFFSSGLRRTKKLINGYLYFLIMFILGLFEFPLNYEVAKSQIDGQFHIFNFSINEAIFVALGMISVLLISAHVVGSKLKQWKSTWSFKKYFLAFLTLSAIFMVLHSMYYLRITNEVEIQQNGLSSTSFDIEDEADTKPLDKTDVQKIEEKIANLMLLNIGFLIIGITLSYFSHDEDEELEYKEKERHKLYEKIKKISKDREKVASKYDMQLRLTEKKIKAVQFQALALIAEYRDWNQKNRKNSENSYPKSKLSLELFSKYDLGQEKDIHLSNMNHYIDSIDEVVLNFTNGEGK